MGRVVILIAICMVLHGNWSPRLWLRYTSCCPAFSVSVSVSVQLHALHLLAQIHGLHSALHASVSLPVYQAQSTHVVQWGCLHFVHAHWSSLFSSVSVTLLLTPCLKTERKRVKDRRLGVCCLHKDRIQVYQSSRAQHLTGGITTHLGCSGCSCCVSG